MSYSDYSREELIQEINKLKPNLDKINIFFNKKYIDKEVQPINIPSNLESLKGIIFQADINFNLFYLQGPVEDLTAFSHEKFASGEVKWKELVHPADREIYENGFENLKNLPGFFNIREYRIIGGDGKIRWFQEIAQNTSNEQGEFLFMQGVLLDCTEQKLLEEELKEKSLQLDSILNSIQDVVWSLTPDSFELIYINPAANKMYGYTDEEFYNDTELWNKIVFSKDEGMILDNFISLLERGSFEIEHRIIRKDGKIRYIHKRAYFGRDAYGSVARIDGIDTDITERKITEEALQESEQKIRHIMENASEIIYSIDFNGEYTFVSTAWTDYLGHDVSEVKGKNFMDFVHPEDLEMSRDFMRTVINNKTIRSSISYRMRHKKGHWRWHNSSASLVIDSYGNAMYLVGVARDITEQKGMEDKLIYLSQHDSLTALYNRSYYEQNLEEMDKEKIIPVTLMICDIDGLKFVNDKLGHSVGDTLLINAAEILKTCFRKSDLIARIGGDEFAILLPESDAIKAQEHYERIKKAIEEYNQNNDGVFISFSIGYAVRDNLDKNMKELFKEADKNMYQEKHKNCEISYKLIIESIDQELNK